MNIHEEILIVDDPGYRNVINQELKAAGYRTLLAQNAQEALVALWEREYIGLVVLDSRLSSRDGLDIFDIIRKDFPEKKIIICSSLQEYKQRFLIDGADAYYDKSEDLSVLVEKVDYIFSGMKEGSREEKRNFRRMTVRTGYGRNRPYMSAAYPPFICRTKDLSPSGGRFVVGEEIKIGQHLSVALESPVNFFPLLIDCEVVWVKKMETSGTSGQYKGSVEAGVRFKLDSADDEQRLKSYLDCA